MTEYLGTGTFVKSDHRHISQVRSSDAFVTGGMACFKSNSVERLKEPYILAILSNNQILFMPSVFSVFMHLKTIH
jgi:hypothetical protein